MKWPRPPFWRPGPFDAVPQPIRCAQCCRYLPSEEAVERLMETIAADVLCEECQQMRATAKTCSSGTVKYPSTEGNPMPRTVLCLAIPAIKRGERMGHYCQLEADHDGDHACLMHEQPHYWPREQQ